MLNKGFEFKCSQGLLERHLTNIVSSRRKSDQNKAVQRECDRKCSHSAEPMLSAGLVGTRSVLIQEKGGFFQLRVHQT